MTTPPPVIKRVITREALAGGNFLRDIMDSAPTLKVLTEAERAASLRATLAARPKGADQVWLFAYGSLIWNPAIDYAERRLARIHGWHRAFCLSTVAGRGTEELPGLVLGLDRGGACTGAAFRLEESVLEHELTLLWRREMLANAYRPTWCGLRDPHGAPFGWAIAFTIRRTGDFYVRLDRTELVRRLATAAGSLGSSRDYLLQTRDGLRTLGIPDRHVEALARAVEAWRG